jgi:GWxTD domain-containing protein
MDHRSRLLHLSALLSLTAGCGPWGRAGSQPKPDHTSAVNQVLDPDAVYKRLGRITAGDPIPFVGSVAYLGGPADSTIVLVGLSLANTSLTFQRQGNEFVAQYRVALHLQGAAGPVDRSRDQTVRVGTFQETQRAEESVLYQDAVSLSPGAYKLDVTLTDLDGLKSSSASADLTVPAFLPGSVTAPILAYQAKGRGARTDQLGLILNPRGAISYGRDTAMAYFEGYQLSGPTQVPVVMVDSRDSTVLRDTLRFEGHREVESTVIRFRPETAPLGELHIIASVGDTQLTAAAVVSFSPNWVVTNFDDMLSLLRYFPPDRVLDSLRKAGPDQRAALWARFWKESDPNPQTPENEALTNYFSRLAQANARFRDEGVPGWRTDRGEALVRLGEPDEVLDLTPQNQGRVIRWGYTALQLVLFFVDESGFGRYRLTPASRAEMERVVSRLSRQAD